MFYIYVNYILNIKQIIRFYFQSIESKRNVTVTITQVNIPVTLVAPCLIVECKREMNVTVTIIQVNIRVTLVAPCLIVECKGEMRTAYKF
jgi:hypothetical protein